MVAGSSCRIFVLRHSIPLHSTFIAYQWHPDRFSLFPAVLYGAFLKPSAEQDPRCFRYPKSTNDCDLRHTGRNADDLSMHAGIVYKRLKNVHCMGITFQSVLNPFHIEKETVHCSPLAVKETHYILYVLDMSAPMSPKRFFGVGYEASPALSTVYCVSVFLPTTNRAPQKVWPTFMCN